LRFCSDIPVFTVEALALFGYFDGFLTGTVDLELNQGCVWLWPADLLHLIVGSDAWCPRRNSLDVVADVKFATDAGDLLVGNGSPFVYKVSPWRGSLFLLVRSVDSWNEGR
jgi:hypothetical protein